LPDTYSTVPAVALKKDSVMVPKPLCEIEAIKGYFEGAKGKEVLAGACYQTDG